MDSLNILRQGITDIADAVRNKTGETSKIPFKQIPEAINNITADILLQNKTITENGEYTADEGYDGLGTVTVNISSSGGSSGGNSTATNTMPNGYTVNFHNSDGVLVQSHSAIFGYWVDEPITFVTDHWEDKNGHVHIFPLVVEEKDGINVVDVYGTEAMTQENIL